MIKEGNRCVKRWRCLQKLVFLPHLSVNGENFRGQRSTAQTREGKGSDGGVTEVMQERREDLDRQIPHLLEIKETE